MRRMSGQNVYVAAVLIGSGLLLGYLFLFYGSDAELAARGPRAGPDSFRRHGGLQTFAGVVRPGVASQRHRRHGQTAEADHRAFRAFGRESRAAGVSCAASAGRHRGADDEPDRALASGAARATAGAPLRHASLSGSRRQDPRGLFLGANDGASGAAVMMELGRAMTGMGGSLGVDFVLFDGEELVYGDNDEYFLGAQALRPAVHGPAAGVSLSGWGAVGHGRRHQSALSVRAQQRAIRAQVVREIWDTAAGWACPSLCRRR